MRIIHDAQVEWHFWTTLYPIFKRSLPSLERLSAANRQHMEIKNAVTNIRIGFLKIPHQLRQPQLDQELDQVAFDSFMAALQSLLDIFEDLVAEEVRQLGYDARPAPATPQEIQLHKRYPKLAIVKQGLQTPESDAGPDGREWSGAWQASAQYSTDVLLKQARYIKFHGPIAPDYCSIADRIKLFNSTVNDIFEASLDASEGDLGNAALLRDDEIEFIRRAHRWNSLSRSLFAILANSINCREAHAARIHLSGFLGPEFNLDLFIAACTEQYWHFANCRWSKLVSNQVERNNSGNGFCSQPEREKAVPKNLKLAFDIEGIWDDTCHEISNESIPVLDASSSLSGLVVPGSADPLKAHFEDCKFEPEDNKIVQLLLACSLLHLNTSHWLQAGWEMEKILVYAGLPKAQNPLERWKLFLTCSLESSLRHDIRDDDVQDILSFGLLMMQMETKLKIEPTDNDNDWESGEPSRDSMLKRVLTDSNWNGKIEDGYKIIVNACLNFRELLEKFYNPVLTADMNRTAAIYKYILAPLHQLVIQRFKSASLCLYGFPDTSGISSAGHLHRSSQRYGSDLVLFDDSSATWHSPENKTWASDFIQGLQPFVEMIRDLEESRNPSSGWAIWRLEKIRIAIIDTGIDNNDIIIETAIGEDRIKERRCFMDGSDDYKDYYGHGTHVARLLLELAPHAELYIAKTSNGKIIKPPDLSRISEAIKWACEKKVHIISMSFGLDDRDTDIDKAITIASNRGITMFAAAANSGGNKPRAYPSDKQNSVICIHASDGRGNDGKISPSPFAKGDNFSTLGISIESRWAKSKVWISGTSFATPIAVALVANVLEFARHKCFLSKYEQECLYRFNGATRILRLMSEERDGYDYVTPHHLWNRKNTDEDITRKITNIARSS